MRNLVKVKVFRVLRDDRGGISMIFALFLVALVGAVGFAIDYSSALRHRSAMQSAADAAVLAAAKDPLLEPAEAAKIAKSYFEANLGPGIDPSSVKFEVEQNPSGSYVATASKPAEAVFGRILGFDKFELGVSASAGSSAGETEVYAVVDVSSSFGIAADPAARARLVALTSPLTPGGCEFACHQRDGWEPAGTTSYEMAKSAGIPLREDVLKDAFATFIDTYMPAGNRAVNKNLKRMGVIGFSESARLLAEPTNDTEIIKGALNLFPDAERINTRYKDVLPQARNMVGSQGTGFNGTAKKTVLLITDGMGWDRYTGGYNGPVDTDLCKQFKDDDIQVAVIEVKYLDASGEYWFDTYVKGLYPSVTPGLKACASPGLYFLANDSDATALGRAFQQAADALRTNLVLN